MTKYYCDYCDIFLTHDAPRVRKDHNSGWKHALQVKAYYQGLNQDKLQRTLAEVIKDYQIRGELVPVPAPIIMKGTAAPRPPLPMPMGMGMMGPPPPGSAIMMGNGPGIRPMMMMMPPTYGMAGTPPQGAITNQNPTAAPWLQHPFQQ